MIDYRSCGLDVSALRDRGIVRLRWAYSRAEGKGRSCGGLFGLLWRDAYAYRSLLRSMGPSFLRRYSVGSRHINRVDPEDGAHAEVDTGWKLEFLPVPAASLGFSFALFAVARRFLISGMTP